MNFRFYGLRRSIKLAWYKATRKNIKWGKGVIVDPQCTIINHGNEITLGDNVYLRGISRGYHLSMPWPTTLLLDAPGAKISIGKNSRIIGSYMHAQCSITVGENSLVGGVVLDCNGHELYSLDRTKGRDKPEPVVIGNNVWTGAFVTILKGTTIGDNCVIGTGSVVKGHFPANKVIMGNPAVVVKDITEGLRKAYPGWDPDQPYNSYQS